MPEGDPRTDGGQPQHARLSDFDGVPNVAHPDEVERPAWARRIGLEDELAFETSAGVLRRCVIGFSTLEEYRGLPVVAKPRELKDEIEADTLAIRREDLAEDIWGEES